MSKTPQALEHMGPFKGNPAFEIFSSLSQQAFSKMTDLTDGPERNGENPREHLRTRMIYVAESTSVAIRLNSSWGLIHPALSLLRDRYEQVVRYSFLVWQKDNSQLKNYIHSDYRIAEKIFDKLRPEQRKFFTEMLRLPEDWKPAPVPVEAERHGKRMECIRSAFDGKNAR